MRVIADVDEADIGEVKEGLRVTFTVDAFPDDVFEGNVTQVRQEATTESNVVTYEVVISAPNQDLKLKPGLTANVTIYTLELHDALAVPTKALRFTPNEIMLAEGETISNVDAEQKVWTKQGNVLQAIAVETGVTNGTVTQILKGLDAGTQLITDIETTQSEEDPAAQQNSNPFMPKPRNNTQKQKKK